MNGQQTTEDLAAVIAESIWVREREDELSKSQYLDENSVPTWEDLGEPTQRGRIYEARGAARAVLAAGYVRPPAGTVYEVHASQMALGVVDSWVGNYEDPDEDYPDIVEEISSAMASALLDEPENHSIVALVIVNPDAAE